eukprot:14398953-Ditylum_brightwellii.AAC.1
MALATINQNFIGNHNSCLALTAKVLALLTSQATETYISRSQLDFAKPTFMPLPSPLQRSAHVIQGSNL